MNSAALLKSLSFSRLHIVRAIECCLNALDRKNVISYKLSDRINVLTIALFEFKITVKNILSGNPSHLQTIHHPCSSFGRFQILNSRIAHDSSSSLFSRLFGSGAILI